jgi:hypothetical protein
MYSKTGGTIAMMEQGVYKTVLQMAGCALLTPFLYSE